MKKIIIIILTIVLYGCYDDDTIKKHYEEKLNEKSSEEYINKYFETICLKGHLYYLYRGYKSGYFAIKLNDDGTPIKCELNK